jgi:hypothetical protein
MQRYKRREREINRAPACVRVLVLLLIAGPARATWIEGKVYCDDGDFQFSAGDTPVDGVVVKAVSQTASPGTTLTDTTGDAVP